MSLCPRCETDLGEAPQGETCPRCGVRLNARRRAPSGFSLPVASAVGSSPPPPSAGQPAAARTTGSRRGAEDDSWGISDLPPQPPTTDAPPAAPVAPKGLGVFRAPTQVAPREGADAGRAPGFFGAAAAPPDDEPGLRTRVLGAEVVAQAEARHAEREVGASTMLLTPQGPPAAPGASKRTAVGVGAARPPTADTRATATGLGAPAVPRAPTDPRRTLVQGPGTPPSAPASTRTTLVMEPAASAAFAHRGDALAPSPPPSMPRSSSRPTPHGLGEPSAPAVVNARDAAEVGVSTLLIAPPLADPPKTGKSTLVMASPFAAPPAQERVGKSTLVMTSAPMGPAPPEERPGKSTLVMTVAPSDTAPTAQPPAADVSPPAARPRLELRRPARETPAEVVAEDVTATKIPALPPVPNHITDRSHPVEGDDAGPTEVMRSSELPFDAETGEDAQDTVDPLGPTQPLDELVVAEAIAPIAPSVAPPAAPAPPRSEEARTAALAAPRGPTARPPRAPTTAQGWSRLRVVGLVAGPALLVAPWLAQQRPGARVPAVLGGALAVAVAAAPFSTGMRGVLSVGLGAALLGALMAATLDLSVLGLALSGALLLVLPGALFHRQDAPRSRTGQALAAMGLAIGIAWLFAPSVGGGLTLHVPPSGAREFAATALIPWLLLGVLAIPRSTAAVSGGLFAGGLLLWAGALGMLRSEALSLASADRWRAVAAHGVSVAALAALVAAGVADAVGAASDDRDA